MNSKVVTVGGIAFAAAAIGGLLYLALAPVATEEVSERDGELRAKKREGGIKTVKAAKRPRASRFSDGAEPAYRTKSHVAAAEEWYSNLPPADREMGKRIQDAQDADNREAILKAAADALSSKSDEVRQSAVDALSMQGEAAMPLLLQYTGDKNKDVADTAYRAWDDAVDGMDAEIFKANAVMAGLESLSDKEHIESAVRKIEMFDRDRAIRALANLAKDGGKAAKAAKESYENLTGEKFKSWAAAELKAMSIEHDNAAAGY